MHKDAQQTIAVGVLIFLICAGLGSCAALLNLDNCRHQAEPAHD